MLYLNHAGTSYPKDPAVHQAAAEALAASPLQSAGLYRRAYEGVAHEFEEGGELIFTSGCTAALHLALGDLPWRAGEMLITSSLEHHALDRVAQGLELHRGVDRRALAYTSARGVDLGELSRLLATHDVRAVAVTAASNITGQHLPLTEMAALAHAHGALLIVDAAQTFGTHLFRETRTSADVIVAAGHKWAGGPQGIGLLYAKKEVGFSCPLAACEIGETACSSFPGFCDVGSVNLSGAAGLASGLRATRPRREQLSQLWGEHAQRIRNALLEHDSLVLLGPSEPAPLSTPVLSFVHKEKPLGELEKSLLALGLQARVGTHCAPLALRTLGEEAGCARISLGGDWGVDKLNQVLFALKNIDA